MNNSRILVIIVFFATLAWIFVEKSKKLPQNEETVAAPELLAKPVVTEKDKEAREVTKPNPTAFTAPGEVVTPTTSQNDTSKEDKTKIEQAELEKLKEFNKYHVSNVTLQMKNDEIASLKKSILNDQLIIKKIEKEGSRIEDYKMLQSNLEIRKKRLQQLLKK